VLTLEILADIYLSNIDNWRDPSILAANPRIADLIPNKPIIVIVPTVCYSSKRPLCIYIRSVLSS
jgi:ABC-type phosphate transport system substrate-binding protein